MTVSLLTQEHGETLRPFVSIFMTFINVGSWPFLVTFTPRFLFRCYSAVVSGVFSLIVTSSCVLSVLTESPVFLCWIL